MLTDMPVLKPLNIICANCQRPYLLDVKEQEWFIEKKMHPPKRCKVCRKTLREKRAASQPR